MNPRPNRSVDLNRWWVVLVGLAMAAQILFIAESHRQIHFRIPIVDAASYHRQAVAIAAGYRPEPRPFWQPPLYAYWLGCVYRFVTTDILVVRLLQGLFGIATVLLTFLSARHCCRTGTAFLAAVVVALYGPLLFFTSQLLPTGMAVAANMAVLYCWLRLSRKPAWPLGLLTGILMGLAALIVSNILVLVPLMLIWVARRALAQRRGAMWTATGGALLAGLILVVAPVTARNCAMSGQFVPISVNAGINLYIGNNPNAARTVAIRPGIDWDRLVAMPYRAGAETDSQAQSFFFRKVVRFARVEPTAFMKGLAGKALQFFNSREIPRNVDLYAFRPFCGTLRALVWQAGGFCFPFGIVAPFALWGMVAATRRERGPWILLAYTLAYSASVIIFFPSSRYAAPVMPAMIIFCALGVESLLGDGQACPPKPWRRRNARPAARIAGCALCLILLVLLNLPLQLPTDAIDYSAELHTNIGVGLQTRGRTEEAVEHYRRALRLNHQYADAHRFLGTAYRAMQKTDLARRSFERTLQIRPDHDQAMQDLAVLLFHEGKAEKSVRLLRQALELNPDNRHTMKNLAIGLLHLRQTEEANQWLRKSGSVDKRGRLRLP